MDADKKIANAEPPRRKPASAQEIKVTTDESTLGLEMMAWLEVHKQKLVAAGAVIIAAVIALVVYNHYTASREMQASEALLALRAPIIGPNRGQMAPAEKYLAIADGFSGTTAGRHALLLGAEALFLEGKYDQARSAFQRFLTENPGHPLGAHADLGIAACLDAAGKRKEAIEAYDLVRKRYPLEAAVTSQARLALARLYEQEGKLEQAYTLYREMVESMRMGYNSWIMEARTRLAALEKSHPQLMALRTPPSTPAPPPAPPAVVTNVVAPPPAPQTGK